MPKTISEHTDFAVYLEGDIVTGFKSAVCRLRHDLGEQVLPVEWIDASDVAVASLASQGITLTALQIRTVWRELLLRSIAQAKFAGGWS
jgi:hypothetical protein